MTKIILVHDFADHLERYYEISDEQFIKLGLDEFRFFVDADRLAPHVLSNVMDNPEIELPKVDLTIRCV